MGEVVPWARYRELLQFQEDSMRRVAFVALHCCLAVSGWVAMDDAHAGVVADYYFNGPVSYSAATQTLSVATGQAGAQIFASAGLPAPFALVPAGQPGSNQRGSELVLSIDLVPASVLDNGFTTTASFAEPTGAQAYFYLGNGAGQAAATPVLTGTLSDMQISGFDGNNSGVLSGYLHPDGGAAYAYFTDPSDVIALDFNLSTNFDAAMYQASFSGQINGQLEALPAVPIAGTLPLLLSGLGVALAMARRRDASSRREKRLT